MVAYEAKFLTKKELGFNLAVPAGVIRLSADKLRVLYHISAKSQVFSGSLKEAGSLPVQGQEG